jgi:hypothetical protein
MNDFDQGGRFQVKSNGEAHVQWLFPRAFVHLRFARWLDSQSAPRPGEPDRRCDTIAELVHREGLSHPRAAVIELFTAPDSEALDRAVEYLGRFRRELRHGPGNRDKYPLVAAMIFLTGTCAEKELKADLPDEDDVETTVRPRVLELAGQDSLVFLDAIEQNRLPRPLLPWAVLMRHSRLASTAERWARLCADLSETQRRTAASLALTFSELVDARRLWRPSLEVFNVNESVLWREVRMGLQRENLLKLLRARLKGDRLAEAVARVEKQDDLATLSRWFDVALTVEPPENFLIEINQ